MITGIHQTHYFPWMGYLDKMAKSEQFILLDDAQIVYPSHMTRNKLLDVRGNEQFIHVSMVRAGHMDVPMKEVKVNNDVDWRVKCSNFIQENYKKSPYFDEMWPYLEQFFQKKYDYVIDVHLGTIDMMRELYKISTPIIMQSSLAYDRDSKKSELVLSLCCASNTGIYLSGVGGKKYMDLDPYTKAGIQVVWQEFTYPQYPQFYGGEFVPNLSALEPLLSIGIEKTRELFWENVKTQQIIGEAVL